MAKQIDNVTCLACGCVCDDLVIQVAEGEIVAAERACRISEPLFVGGQKNGSCKAEIEGKEVSLEKAIEHASAILGSSSAPLIGGLTESTIEAQRAALELADQLGAILDPSLSLFHRAALVALQSVGISTCTLGEVKQRADVILFWGCDPIMTHPRFFERFIEPPGKFVSNGRHVIVVAAERNETVGHADAFLEIQPESDFGVLAVLRAIIGGVEIEEMSFGGVSLENLHALAAKLQAAEYSVIFFGSSIGEQDNASANLESLFLLVRQLNGTSRCCTIGLGGPIAENILAWQTGYPCGVNFAAGYPRYDPDVYSANKLLECGEVDAALMIGSGGIEHLSDQARENLRDLPLILLETAKNNSIDETRLAPALRIPVAQPGLHTGGTAFRMDGVPLPLRPLLESPLSSEEEVLAAILEGVLAKCS